MFFYLQQGSYVLSKTNTLDLSLCILRTFLLYHILQQVELYLCTPVTWFIVQYFHLNTPELSLQYLEHVFAKCASLHLSSLTVFSNTCIFHSTP